MNLAKKLFAVASTASILTSSICVGTAYGKQEPTLTLTVYQPYFQKSAQGTLLQKKWVQMMEQYMGMKLNINWHEIPWSDYETKESTYLASGKLADVSLFVTNTDISKAGQEGAIVDLMPYLKKGSMPYYAKFLSQDGNLSKIEDNGHLYQFADGLYSNSYTNYGTQASWIFRFDIFKKAHLPIPSTMQQLYSEGLKLKKLYPKSYLLGSSYGQTSLISVFVNANHTNLGFYFNGKKYVFGPLDDASRFENTIKYLHKMYAAGLIDPNFMSIQNTQFNSQADGNKFFVVPDAYGEFTNNCQGADNLNVKGFHGQWGVAAPPKNLNGQISWKTSTTIPGFNAETPFWGSVIFSRAQNIPALVKLLDYQYSPQIIDLYNYGIKGLTYTIGKDGQPHFTPKVMKVPAGQEPSNSTFLNKIPVDPGSNVRIGIQWIAQSRVAEDQLYGPIPVYKNGKYFSTTIWHFNAIADGGVKSLDPNTVAPVLPLTDQQLNQISNITTNLQTFVDENVPNFIIGKESFSQWPQFIQKLKAQGNIQQVLDLDNAALAQLEKQNHWSYAKAAGLKN